jgi:glycerol-3-phosphate cytidylyltransferase-like family protein
LFDGQFDVFHEGYHDFINQAPSLITGIYDKLNISGSVGYQAYRSSRCIIAVKGFGETEL